jgi:hypothetical protein
LCPGRGEEGWRANLHVSKWAGHYDTAFTYSTYVHASDEDPKTGTDALGKIYKLK